MKGIAPGTYRLSATRAGYLQSQYGARGPGKQGTPLTLVARQSMTALEMRMTRGGVITGKVLDDLGDPVERATVAAMRYRVQGNERQLVPDGQRQHGRPRQLPGIRHRARPLLLARYAFQLQPLQHQLIRTAHGDHLHPCLLSRTRRRKARRGRSKSAPEASWRGVNFALTRSRTYRITGDVQDMIGTGNTITVLLRNRKGPRCRAGRVLRP